MTQARHLAVALLLLGLGGASAVRAEGPPPSLPASAFQTTTLNLSAYGEVTAQPDMATVSLGVTSTAPTAAAAVARNAAAMDAVVRGLKAQGIAAREIQTSNFSLNAQYVYADKQPPRLTGYEASNQVAATVRDMGRLGFLLDGLIGAGANRVNGVSFGLQNPRRAEDEARKAAFVALTDKAQLYAAAAGLSVRRLVTLSEGGGQGPLAPEPMMAMKAARFAAPSTPVEAGELKVRIDVNGLYELGR